MTAAPARPAFTDLQRDIQEALAWSEYHENTSRYAGTAYYELWEPACWRTLKAKLKEAGVSYA